MDEKIMIAIPTLDYIHYKFVESLTKLTRRLDREKINYDVVFKGGTLVYLSRDWIVRHAASNGYTHILWLDADMVFDDDILDKLLQDDKDIVTGVYVSRHVDKGSVLFEDLHGKKRYTEYPDKMFEIEGCGFGCVLTKTSALRKVMDYHGTCFLPTLEFGEDLACCERLLKHGFKMYSDPRVKAGHIGQAIVMPYGTKYLI